MRTKYPNSLKELLLLLNETSSHNVTKYFRGQADYTWEIKPSLARNKNITNINDLLRIEQKLIEKFKKIIRDNKLDDLIPVIKNGYDPSWILVMAAQHYGLPTRLLDFTHDQYTALEFAVADLQNLNKDGALIIYEDVNLTQKGFSIFENPYYDSYKDSFLLQVPSFFSPKISERKLSESRKIIQGSKFLYRDTLHIYHCLSIDKAHTERLIKVHIPCKLKQDIVNYLIKMEKMACDLLAGKNDLDRYAAILRIEFSELNKSNIENYLK